MADTPSTRVADSTLFVSDSIKDLQGLNRHRKKELLVRQEEQLKLPLQLDPSLQHLCEHTWPVKRLWNLFSSLKKNGIFSSAISTIYIYPKSSYLPSRFIVPVLLPLARVRAL